MTQYVLHWQRIVDSINGMPKKAHVQVVNLTARYNYIIGLFWSSQANRICTCLHSNFKRKNVNLGKLGNGGLTFHLQ